MNNNRSIQLNISLVFFVMFLYGICHQAIGTLITRIITHYDILMVQAGFLSSFFSAGQITAMFVIIFFVGRINKLILLGTSLLLFAISLSLISTAPLFGILLVCFSLLGLFGATMDTLANSLVADLMPAQVSRNLSWLHGLFGVGALCGPVVIERLAGTQGWAQVYFYLSMVFLLYLAIYSVATKWQWSLLKMRISNEKQSRFGFSDIIQFFKRKRCLLLWLTMFFYVGIQSIVIVWGKRYVETHLGAAEWGAYALSAFWIGTTISRLVISPIIKVSSPKKLLFGNLIAAIALLTGLFGASTGVMIAALFIVGLGSGLSIPLIIAMGCEWYKEKTAFGTMMPFTAAFISFVIFPPLSGLVSDFLGIPWGLTLGAVNAIFAVVFSAMLGASLKQEAA